MHNSIRDIAGIATVSVSPYIQRREKISEAIDYDRAHPFSVMVFDPAKPGHFEWNKMVGPQLERGGPGGTKLERTRPLLNPYAPRHIHIAWKEVERKSEDGKLHIERAPVFVVDFVLRVVPPAGDEIVLGEIRSLVYDLTAHGYNITMVTMDQFQSADTLQTLTGKGYSAELLSVDRTPDPYDNLKMALYEGRVNYYPYKPLTKELRELELHFTGQKKRKIDHPVKGSKDCADALAGACFSLLEERETVPLPILKGMASYGNDDAWMAEQQQAKAGGNRNAGQNTSSKALDLLPPFLIGGGSGGDDWGGGWNPGSL